MEAIEELPFFSILDKQDVLIKNYHDDRMAVVIAPAEEEPPEDIFTWDAAIVVITGEFTPGEMDEVEALARYEHAPLREAVSALVAKQAVEMHAKGVSTIQQILGAAQ